MTAKTRKTKKSTEVSKMTGCMQTTFIPTVMFTDVEQWFKAFYYGEYGEMILNRIIKFYKYIRVMAPTADIVYIVKPSATKNEWDLLPQEVKDCYHLMNDLGCDRMELCMIDPFDFENELKDIYFKRIY